MRQYETVFLISPNLEEEETTKIITQISGIISKEKGKLIQEDRWGKKRLAYPIKKFEEAFYVFFHYEGDSNIPLELEKRFKQTEAILRFLTVKKETRENVRKKRKGIPAEEETAAPAAEAEIVAPQEEKVEEKVELKEGEEISVPAKEEEIVAPQDEEKVEEKAELKEGEEISVPAKEEEIVAPQDEEKVEEKAELKEGEEISVPAKEEEIAVPQDEEKVEKKEDEEVEEKAEKKKGDKEDLNSTETIKEDK
jgi:small subunit ribosomal protein S6